jgi:hypothetical protein
LLIVRYGFGMAEEAEGRLGRRKEKKRKVRGECE